MPQTIHRGIKSLIDEANAEIETVSAADAIKAAQNADVVIVDIRDPREIERDGKIPGAFSCTRGMLEFWIDPQSPYAKPIFQEDKKFIFHCAGGMRSALAAKTAQGHGPEAGRAYGRRFCRLARRRRPDREVGAEEEGVEARSTSPSCPGLSRVSTSSKPVIAKTWMAGSSPAMTIRAMTTEIRIHDHHRRSARLHRMARRASRTIPRSR